MKKYYKTNFKVGDTVYVVSGFSKNKIGKIIKINRFENTVIVSGVNYKFKSVKPKTRNDYGSIKKMEFPINTSNVLLNLK